MWIYNKEPFDKAINGARGFVYLIKNNDTNQWYIGKKTFWCRKNKKWQESDWKTYQSSSEYAKKWTNVTKIILHICFTDFELSYTEIEYQIRYKCLLRDDCVNYAIGSQKIGRCPDYMKV